MDKHINLKNGNPTAWKTAGELTDEETAQALEAIAQINRKAATAEDPDGKIGRAAYEAEAAGDEDRAYIEAWCRVMGELVIG